MSVLNEHYNPQAPLRARYVTTAESQSSPTATHATSAPRAVNPDHLEGFGGAPAFCATNHHCHTMLSVFLHGKRSHMPRVTMQATYKPAEGLKPQQPGATATEVDCENGHSSGAQANVSLKAIASHIDFANDYDLSLVKR